MRARLHGHDVSAMFKGGERMTSVRWLSFALVTALLLATAARAGSSGTFATPLSDPSVCGDLNAVNGFALVDVFVSSPRCDSLCKKAESECSKFARKVTSCYQGWFNDSASFVMKSCGELVPSAAASACKDNTKAQIRVVKNALASELQSNLANCDLWGAMCRSECLGSM